MNNEEIKNMSDEEAAKKLYQDWVMREDAIKCFIDGCNHVRSQQQQKDELLKEMALILARVYNWNIIEKERVKKALVNYDNLSK